MPEPSPPVPALPPARTAPGVAIATGSGFVSTFATSIQYLGPWNWPLPAPTDVQALALAGFVVSVGATVFHLWASRRHARATADSVPAQPVNPAP